MADHAINGISINGRKALAIDDQKSSLDLLGRIFAEHLPDIEFHSRKSGKAGIRAAKKIMPDIIILDVKMPGMDGFEVCSRIKKDRGLQNIPVLIISGVYIDSEDRTAALNLGAEGYLYKPFKTAELVANIKILLRIKTDEDELRKRQSSLEAYIRICEGGLEESIQRFRALFEHSPEAVLVETPDGRILDANPAACHLYDLSPIEIEGALRTPDGLMRRAEKNDEFIKISDNLMGDVVSSHIRYTGKDARLIHVKDMSERRRIDNALQEVLEGASSSTGFIFFFSLVEHLTKALNIDCAIMGEIDEHNPDAFSMVSVYPGDLQTLRLKPADIYPNASSEEIKPLTLLENAKDYYNPDNVLYKWGLEAIIAVPLAGDDGTLLGILAIIHHEKIDDPRLAQTLMQIFATRTAAELERKRTMEALWKSEERYRSLTDDVMGSSSIGTLIVDAERHIVWANKAFFELFSIHENNLIGQNKSRVLEQILNKIEDADYFEKAVTESYINNTPLNPIQCHIPATDKTEELWIRHWSQSVQSGLYIGGRIEHYADITRQMQAEGAHKKLEMAVEQAAEIFLITNTNGVVQYANPAFEDITGYSVKEVLGKSLGFLKSDYHDDIFYQKIWATLADGIVWSGHITHRKKDGEDYKAEMVISPIRDAGKRIINYVVVSRDVTHEMELEEQFRQAQKMESIGRLAGGVAHDFNNLLTSILGFARLVQDDLENNESAWNDIQEIINAGERATNLTKQLLAISRKETMQLSCLDINEVFENMENLLQRTLAEDIEISMDLAALPPLIKADRGLFEQILMNLAVNSRDAMPRGGKLTISTRQVELTERFCADNIDYTPGRYALVSIKDTGEGMSPEICKLAFEPFFTTKPKGKGTGLGLATVYGIVKQLKGNIEIKSRVGRGTEVLLYFHLSEEEAKQKLTETVPEPPCRGTETILLVEDEDPVRALSGRILSALGYHILTAANGTEALKIAKDFEKPIHLVLSDIVMPHMNGPTMVEKLHNIRSDFKTLYCSGFAEDRILEYGLKDHTAKILPKPFTAKQLSDSVRQILDHS